MRKTGAPLASAATRTPQLTARALPEASRARATGSLPPTDRTEPKPGRRRSSRTGPDHACRDRRRPRRTGDLRSTTERSAIRDGSVPRSCRSLKLSFRFAPRASRWRRPCDPPAACPSPPWRRRPTRAAEPCRCSRRHIRSSGPPLRHEGRGHDAIEKVAIMAHQPARSRIVRDQLLQELEGFEVEVVRRLVEDEEVRRLRQRPREHEPVALAAGKDADGGAACSGANRNPSCRRRRACAGRRPRPYSPPPPVRVSATVASGSSLSRRWSRRRHPEIGAEPDRAGVGRQRAGEEVQERRLAGAVRADDPEPVAAQDPGESRARSRRSPI